MSVLVVGLSHRTAPVAVLERAALDVDATAKLLADVVVDEHMAEAMVLSTCNRVELYADVDRFHGGVAEATEMLARHADVPVQALTQHLYVHYEGRAVAHLFSVACGLDSMVVGESQVLAQIKVALRVAQEANTAGRTLGSLAQQALRVGKRARTETGIDRAGRTLVTAGLDEAERRFGPLPDRTVLVVGAGAMSALSATVVAQRGAGQLLVANRTVGRAQRLAGSVGGQALPLEALPAALAASDLVISCTGSVGHVLSADLIAQTQRERGHRPLVLLDLALPRDVDPAASEIEGVQVIDLASMATALAGHEHGADIDAVRGIVAEEVTAFLGWQRAASVAPTVVALRDMAERVVRSELDRLQGRLPGLDDRSRSEIEQAVRRVVDKVLHSPTVRVKELAEEPGGHSYAEALTTLFGLDPQDVEALTRAELTDPGAAAGAAT